MIVTRMQQEQSPSPLLAIISNALFLIFIIWWVQSSVQPDDFLYLFCTSATSAICFFIIVNPWKPDTLEPIKLIAFFYGMSFGLGPLLLAGEGVYQIPYLGGSWLRLLGEGSLWGLIGLCCLLVGYYSYPILSRNRGGTTSLILSRGARKTVSIFGVALLAIGAASYLVLVRQAGGLGHFITYSSGRADIFSGAFGGFYFGTFFLISGLGAISCIHAKKHPLIIMGVAVVIGGAYSLFQGREEAIAPIICGIISIHYGHRRLKTRWLIIAGAIIILLASFIGYFRSAEKSQSHKTDVVIGDFGQKIQIHLRKTLSQNLEQMDAFLIALRYVETTHKTLGGDTLLAWFEPIDRHILGNIIDSVQAGRFMTILVIPEHRWSNTALSPSILGELYLNFSYQGIIVGLLLYGVIVRWLYEKVSRVDSNPLILMVYPYTIWILSKAVIDGSGLLFRPFIIALPILVISLAIAGKSSSQPLVPTSRPIEGSNPQ